MISIRKTGKMLGAKAYEMWTNGEELEIKCIKTTSRGFRNYVEVKVELSDRNWEVYIWEMYIDKSIPISGKHTPQTTNYSLGKTLGR